MKRRRQRRDYLNVDLLGDPIDPGHGLGGRPRHIATAERRALVRAMKAEGQPQWAIAQALGITEPTLRLAYPVELDSRSITARRRAARDRKGLT